MPVKVELLGFDSQPAVASSQNQLSQQTVNLWGTERVGSHFFAQPDNMSAQRTCSNDLRRLPLINEPHQPRDHPAQFILIAPEFIDLSVDREA